MEQVKKAEKVFSYFEVGPVMIALIVLRYFLHL